MQSMIGWMVNELDIWVEVWAIHLSWKVILWLTSGARHKKNLNSHFIQNLKYQQFKGEPQQMKALKSAHVPSLVLTRWASPGWQSLSQLSGMLHSGLLAWPTLQRETEQTQFIGC